MLASRRLTAPILTVLIACLLAMTGCAQQPTTSGATAGAKHAVNYIPHVSGWAGLVRAASDFYTKMNATYAKTGTYRLANNPATVATKIGFANKYGTLSAYTGGSHSYHYCLTDNSGEFYAAVSKDGVQQTRTVMGLGGCNFTSGVVVTTDTAVIKGKPLLGDIKTALPLDTGDTTKKPTKTSTPTNTMNGHDTRLLTAATSTAVALGIFHDHYQRLPLRLTAPVRSRLGLAYTSGIRLGYYVPHGSAGFTVCVTDRHEEAVYAATKNGAGITRFTTGTC